MNYLYRDNPYVEAFGSTPYLTVPGSRMGGYGTLDGLGADPPATGGIPEWATGPIASAAAYVLKSGRMDPRGIIVFGLIGLGIQGIVRKVVTADNTVVGIAAGLGSWYFYDFTGIGELAPLKGGFRLPTLKGLFGRSGATAAAAADEEDEEDLKYEQLLNDNQDIHRAIDRIAGVLQSRQIHVAPWRKRE